MRRKPKPLGQMHLSTAVVMMFVGGVWAGVFSLTLDYSLSNPKDERPFEMIVFIARVAIICGAVVCLWITRNVSEWWIETDWGWFE